MRHIRRFFVGTVALVALCLSVVSSVSASPSFRGMNTLSSLTPAELTELHQLLNPRMIRYSIGFGTRADTMSVAQYMSEVTAVLDNLDTNLAPLLRQYNMKIVLSIGTPPGGFSSIAPPLPQFRIFSERAFQQAMKDLWSMLSARYAGSDIIAAYHLLSEPATGVRPAAGLSHWYVLQRELVSLVRQNDKKTPIMVTAEYSSPTKLRKVQPARNSGALWYAVNMYHPIDFLRQGVENPAYRYSWPDNKKKFNSLTLQKYIRPTVLFAKLRRSRIFVTEFTTSRFALRDGGTRYLKDVLTLFARNKWYWAFHAWAEADVWDVRFPAQDDTTSGLTKRAALLRKAFGN